MLTTILAFIGAIVVIAIAGILVYAATLPNHFQVSRSMLINAAPETVYPLIANLRTFNVWNPFAKQDPSMVITYNGPDSGKGAGYSWQGKKGRGRSSITDTVAPTRIDMRLDMEKPMEGHPDIVFALVPKGAATEVSWSMSGPWPYLHRIFGTICNMDKMVGGEFLKGLTDLKAMAEK